jgi:hypothetical protein
MIGDWSGAIIYEWIQEENNYGIVSYSPEPARDEVTTVVDNGSRHGTPTPISPDFDNLKSKWATIDPTGVSRDDYDPSHVSTRPCPTSTEGGWWALEGNVRLPAIDETVTAFASSSGGGTDGAATTAADSDQPSPSSGGEDSEDDDSVGSKSNVFNGAVIAAAVVLYQIVYV